MRETASSTATLVAVCRGLGRRLSKEAQLVDDPYGTLFAGPGLTVLLERAESVVGIPLWPLILYMQVRTRVIDDVVRQFAREGGRQVLILGAGYDCRAARFGAELPELSFFEVDHPATQARKREVLGRAGVGAEAARYLAWDFERQSVASLPDALAAIGHDRAKRTLTIWEGVTMYLTVPAVESSVAAVHALSSKGSPFMVHYLAEGQIERPSLPRRVMARIVAGWGEPFRFGWDPPRLPAWFRARGFEVEWNRSSLDLGVELLPGRLARAVGRAGNHFALLRAD